MARYLVNVRTPMSPTEAFAYMADLRNFAEWDPGVERVTQVRGQGAGPDAAFDVVVKTGPSSTTLRYEVQQWDEPHLVLAVAENRWLVSRDTITVRADGDGAVVTYDAVLTLKGPLALADRLLRLSFDKIGDRAANGLVAKLSGQRVAA